MRRLFAMVTLCVAVSGTCTAPAHAATKLERSQARQLKSLKQQRATLRRQLTAATRVAAADEQAITDLSEQLAGVTEERDALEPQVITLTQQRDKLLTETTALNASVSEQVAAIARRDDPAQLQNLVLAPAHSNWMCGGSIYIGSTFLSYDFDLRTSYDGSCY